MSGEKKPVLIRFNDEEYELLQKVKKKLGLTHDTEVIRHAIRLAYEHYFGGGRRGE